MKLGFDLSATQHPNGIRHGGGEYAKSVLSALLARRHGADLVALRRADWSLDPDVASMCSGAGVNVLGCADFSGFGRLIQQEGVTRFFSGVPYHLGPLDFGRCEVVLAVHGIRSIELPTDEFEDRYAKSVTRKAKIAIKQAWPAAYRRRQVAKLAQLLRVRAAKRTIIVSSNHTKNALLCEFNWLAEQDVKVRYCPRSHVTGVEPVGEDYLDSVDLSARRFVLIVSAGRWEKNAFRAVRALCGGIRRVPALGNLRVAVTGGLPESMQREYRDLAVVLPYTSDAQLARLYRSCFAFMYPTLNEGFGYPPLEAMTHGAPVLASAVCSIPEIAGSAAIYFDPRSEIEMKARVLQLALEPGLRDRMIGLGRDRAAMIGERQDRDLQSLVSILVGP